MMEYIPKDNPMGREYIEAMKVAQEYATMNRHEMMARIAGFLDPAGACSVYFESTLNYIDFEDGIIRKGAIRAHKGEYCVIPFNSADGTAICTGKGNREWNQSAPHGAGRLMSRTRALRELDVSEYQARLDANGVYSSTAGESTLDEAPAAYKPMASILAAIEPTVDVVTMLKPFYNFKAAEGGKA